MPSPHAPRPDASAPSSADRREADPLNEDSGDDDAFLDNSTRTPHSLRESADEQVEFREHFDEDLYNDREEAPAQGNTADVAMGEQRFGSDAEAYAEYAHRRPGEDSAVGQSRDPADIADEDDVLP